MLTFLTCVRPVICSPYLPVSCRRVDGYLPSGDAVTSSSTATQTLHRTAGVATSVNATMRDSDSVPGDSAGDTIEYTIQLVNEGTTTLTGISVYSALLMAQEARYRGHRFVSDFSFHAAYLLSSGVRVRATDITYRVCILSSSPW